MKQSNPLVAILMGSESDREVMSGAVKMFEEFGVPSELKVLSAHRTPDKVRKYVRAAPGRGVKVFIAGAGKAAHLAGAVAAQTILPVIGVPLDAGLGGLDSLLSTVQMPRGIPVATVAIGRTGAVNAALLATQILALSDAELALALGRHRAQMARGK